MFYQRINVLTATYYLVFDELGVVYLSQENGQVEEVLTKFACAKLVVNHPLSLEVERQLTAYFLKETKQLTFPIHLIGTNFQQTV
jgi:O6-methylguanine-DNA--protein-cysteine methyltransferase